MVDHEKICDKCCNNVKKDSELYETTAITYYCKSCVEDYVNCNTCGRAIVNSNYDFDNVCDDCVDNFVR